MKNLIKGVGLAFIVVIGLLQNAKSQTALNHDLALCQLTDSLLVVYHKGNKEEKLSAALPLWSLYSQNLFSDPNSCGGFHEIDTGEISNFIVANSTEQNQETAINFQLLKAITAHFREKKVNLRLNESQLNNEQKAIYYWLKIPGSQNFGWSAMQEFEQMQKCLRLTEKSKNQIGLRYRLLTDISYFFYHKRQLDSAIFYYEKFKAEIQHYKSSFVVYCPGYGVVKFVDGMKMAPIMNLGNCLEKAGYLNKAIDHYQTAVNGYMKAGLPSGVYWGKTQLINAYLDLGDSKRAQILFKELLQYHKSHDGEVKFESDALRSAFFEFDYFDLQDNAHFIDSIITYVERSTGAFKVRTIPDEYGYAYLSQAGVYTYSLIAKHLARGVAISAYVLDTLQLMRNRHYSQTQSPPVVRKSMGKSLDALWLCWQIALNPNSNANHLDSLIAFFKDENELGGHTIVFKQAILILHANQKYEEEIALINEYLSRFKNGKFIVDLRKLHFQLSKAYEQAENLNKAFFHYKKYDSLRVKTQSLGYYEQLSRLDKTLELERERSAKNLLTKENQLLQTRRNLWAIGSISVVIILIFIVLFLVTKRMRNEAIKRAQLAELSLLRQNISKKENALERTAFELAKSNTSFGQLLSKIEELSAKLNVDIRRKFRSVLLEFRANLQNETWQQFNLEFQEANSQFYQDLLAKNETLTESELRIAALQISGLSNKEISAITGQQLGSIHTHKSHLRKKLGVNNDAELVDLLNEIKG
ncbi:MAG: hypothetical protein KDC92_00365 [Bacteroidetes bacterium]|nr:hypothetical protein [Bacteroidota bacterium]